MMNDSEQPVTANGAPREIHQLLDAIWARPDLSSPVTLGGTRMVGGVPLNLVVGKCPSIAALVECYAERYRNIAERAAGALYEAMVEHGAPICHSVIPSGEFGVDTPTVCVAVAIGDNCSGRLDRLVRLAVERLIEGVDDR